MLSELAGLSVYIHCLTCQRVLARWADDIIAELGDISMEDLSKRMKCSKCGTRGPALSPWTGGAFPPIIP